MYWPQLRGLDWRFTWRAAVVGVVVVGLWLGASQLLLPSQGMPPGLAAMTSPERSLWIAARLATSVVVLPLAEELAYHGYLMRRLVAGDFESVFFATVGWIPLLVTALAYGLLNGALWAPGIAASIILGMLLIRTRRMGEAVAAYALSNALLCAAVLFWHQWQLW